MSGKSHRGEIDLLSWSWGASRTEDGFDGVFQLENGPTLTFEDSPTPALGQAIFLPILNRLAGDPENAQGGNMGGGSGAGKASFQDLSFTVYYEKSTRTVTLESESAADDGVAAPGEGTSGEIVLVNPSMEDLRQAVEGILTSDMDLL